MANSIVQLSKLSRGRGENKGSYIEVVYDDEDVNNLHYSEILHSSYGKKKSIQNKSLNIPKTFTTRKGPLLLFSEDFVGKFQLINSYDSVNSSSEINSPSLELKEKTPIKTINELRTSILTFGDPSDCLGDVNDVDAYRSSGVGRIKRENTLAYLKFFKNKNTTKGLEEKIRPGFSAKRYLANWSKHWRPEIYDNLFKEGKLREETLYEYSEILPHIKHRIDDNLSRIPPAYRIQHQWLAISVQPLKGYRFFRASNDLLGIMDESDSIKEKSVSEVMDEDDQIKVLDKEGNQIEYNKLSREEQEVLLTELLLQTALRHIAEKNVELFDASLRNPHNNSLNMSFKVQSTLDEQFSKKIPVKQFDPNEILSNADTTLIRPNKSGYMFRSMPGNKLTAYTDKTPPLGKAGTLPPLDTQYPAILKKDDEMNQCDVDDVFEPVGLSDIKQQKPDLFDAISTRSTSIDSYMNENDKVYSPNLMRVTGEENMKLINEKGVDRIQFNINKKDQQNEPNKPINNPSNDLERKLSGALLVAPGGNIVKVGHSLSRTGTDRNALSNRDKSNKKRGDTVNRVENQSYRHKSRLGANLVANRELGFASSSEHFNNESSRKASRKSRKSHGPENLQYPPLNKEIIQALANHAQQIAKHALNQDGAGVSLVTDVKSAINENYKKFKSAFKAGQISTTEYEQYNNVMKDALRKSLSDLFSVKSDLNDVLIDDNLLENLLDLPPEAFELIEDKINNTKYIRVKSGFINRIKSATTTPFTLEELNLNLNDLKQSPSKVALNDTNLPESERDSPPNESKRDKILDNEQQVPLNSVSENKLPSILKPTVSITEPPKSPPKPTVKPKVESILSINELNTPKPASDESEKKVTLKTSDNIKNVKAPNNYAGTAKAQPVPTVAIESAKSKKKPKERDSAAPNTEVVDDEKIDKKVFKVGKVKDPKPPTSLEPATTDSSQKKKPADKKVKNDKKPKKPKNTEITEKSKQPAKVAGKQEIEIPISQSIEAAEDQKSEEMENEEPVEDEGSYNITLIQRNESPVTDTTEIYKPVKRQPNLPNAPPPQQANPNQLSEEELARQKDLEMSEAMLRNMNAAEIRDYKRRMAAEEKRKEMMRKRLEKEEQKRKEEEDALRREKQAEEFAAEQERRAEEMRRRRLLEQERRQREEEEDEERQRRLLLQAEQEKKMKEEYARKMEEMRLKMVEEMERKARLEQERLEEEERRRLAEIEMMRYMNERQKEEYLRRKQEEEDARKRAEEEERIRREEELARALEEAKAQALAEAKLKAELERRLQFMRSLYNESKELDQAHSLTRAFVFSYFELLKYLGLEIPKDIIAKMLKMGAIK